MEESKGPAATAGKEESHPEKPAEAERRGSVPEERGLDMRVMDSKRDSEVSGTQNHTQSNGQPSHGVPSQQSPVPAAVPPPSVVGRSSNFSISSILSGSGKNDSHKETSKEHEAEGKESAQRDLERDLVAQELQHREALSSAHAALMTEHMEKLGHAFTQVQPGSGGAGGVGVGVGAGAGGIHPSAALLGMRPEYLYHAVAAAGLRGLTSLAAATAPGAAAALTGLPPPHHPLHAGPPTPASPGQDEKHSPGKPIPWHPWFSHHPFLPMSYTNGKHSNFCLKNCKC